MTSSLRLMVFYTVKECVKGIEGEGVLRLVNLQTKKTIASYKVSRLLDTFLFLQDAVEASFEPCFDTPVSQQCFGFHWHNAEWAGKEAEEMLCKWEFQNVVDRYIKQKCVLGKQ